MLLLHRENRNTWSLFIGHLMIEKLLKALFIKKNQEFPPFIHNLLRLAEKSDLSMTEAQRLSLATITAFNINTRYDDYKQTFHQKCTAEYTSLWVQEIQEIREWILQQMRE